MTIFGSIIKYKKTYNIYIYIIYILVRKIFFKIFFTKNIK